MKKSKGIHVSVMQVLLWQCTFLAHEVHNQSVLWPRSARVGFRVAPCISHSETEVGEISHWGSVLFLVGSRKARGTNGNI